MAPDSNVSAALAYFKQQRTDETWQQKLLALENFNQETVRELVEADCRHQWPFASSKDVPRRAVEQTGERHGRKD